MIPIGVHTGGSSRFLTRKHHFTSSQRKPTTEASSSQAIPSGTTRDSCQDTLVQLHRSFDGFDSSGRSIQNGSSGLAHPLPGMNSWPVGERSQRQLKVSNCDLEPSGTAAVRYLSKAPTYKPWHYERPVRRYVEVPKRVHSVCWDPSLRTGHPTALGKTLTKDQATPRTPATVASAETPSPVAAASKRSASVSDSVVIKRSKGIEKLDMLVSASLEVGPMLEVDGCSCPKSKCIALYCDCFKAGRRCNPKSCSCLNCKNTVAESGPNGARTLAIRSILSRNPRAFITAGMPNQPLKSDPGVTVCNCVRSRCLKLYCTCFQIGETCKEGSCTCVKCENVEGSDSREEAVRVTLEKRPDAFETKPKESGAGCACKNNRCVRKYCECFRLGRRCKEGTCSCNDCLNSTADSI